MRATKYFRSMAIISMVIIGLGCTPPEPVTGAVNHIVKTIDPFDKSITYRTQYFNLVAERGEFGCPFWARLISDKPESEPRIIVNYVGSEWFFLSKIEIKTSDGVIIQLDDMGHDRDVSGTIVKEYVRFLPTIEQLRIMSKSDSLEFRLTGIKTGSTRTNFIHANFIWSLRQFITLYDENQPASTEAR